MMLNEWPLHIHVYRHTLMDIQCHGIQYTETSSNQRYCSSPAILPPTRSQKANQNVTQFSGSITVAEQHFSGQLCPHCVISLGAKLHQEHMWVLYGRPWVPHYMHFIYSLYMAHKKKNESAVFNLFGKPFARTITAHLMTSLQQGTTFSFEQHPIIHLLPFF